MSFEIAGISAEHGTKATGSLFVTNMPDGSPVSVPFTLINGAEDGPTLLIEGGVHGNELYGPLAILKLGRTLDPKKLKGKLILIPILNIASLNNYSRTNPIDNIDMNRIFPGGAEKQAELRGLTIGIAGAYFNKIVKKADYAITFHNGGGPWPLLHVIGVDDTPEMDPDVVKKSFEMAKAFGLEVVVKRSKTHLTGTLMTWAGKTGIPIICPEVGNRHDKDGFGENNKYTKLNEKGIANVMKYLGMLEGEVEYPKYQIVIDYMWHPCQRGGLWLGELEPFNKAKRGALIGRIVNPFTWEELERYEAPYDGYLIAQWDMVARPGSWVFGYGKIIEEIKR